ncbi:MAG TPA: low-specificity L-threonine aldolase [Kosmotogaceae bacterium]|nr:MAG: Threonine aldolase [Thermotogales bacterium 46_20]HAA85577.1 low-specificity L-threonine aldolase [Kosmotogaceae bacterium]
MKWIDLRSDTVTQPTPEMRKAMSEAVVGDDVYSDDPTVNELERLAAEMLGKEAALFVPSGTFGNQLALLTHTLRGDEVIVPSSNHIFVHEVGAASVISGVQLRIIESDDGMPALERIENAIRDDDLHSPRTSLISLETAHSSGRVLPVSYLESVRALADSNGLLIHLDGARIFNAAVALGISVADIARSADSVMFCLSKGLSAPVGSMLVGDEEFIKRARKGRKLMGGAMRQAGVIAAAGIVALKTMVERLGEDHENAKYFASALDQIPEISVFKERLDINMVFFRLEEIPGDYVVEHLERNRIKINPPDRGLYRLVTNKDVSREELEATANIVENAVRSWKSSH